MKHYLKKIIILKYHLNFFVEIKLKQTIKFEITLNKVNKRNHIQMLLIEFY